MDYCSRQFKKNLLLLLLSTAIFQMASYCQELKVYPTNWWVGMKWNKVQLVVHQKDISTTAIRLKPYPGVQLKKQFRASSDNYAFIDLEISPSAKPGKLNFVKGAGSIPLFSFELKPRRAGNGTSFAQGVRSPDFIYMLMPDRFSNGDTGNDRVPGMRDQSLNRDSIFLRHGGDLQGVANHLDYLQELGATAVWMTPVLENDMPHRSEHGYAITDHYTIEPRFGGATAYHQLSDALHNRGMKLVQDAVYNHIGLQHWIMLDPPDSNWVHQWPTFTQPNYKEQVFFDPHAAKTDIKKMADGWFARQMPDLNQDNPLVANFLLQHAIWCVEEFGVDGWRVDTYKYVDLNFMNRCNKALTDEYPRLTIFGENWCDDLISQAYLTRNTLQVPFKSNLIGAADFEALFRGILPAIRDKDGGNQLYKTLAGDMLYQDPMNNVIFLDNHDITRFYSEVKEDTAKLKAGLAWLLTCRGIPQLYYGTEVLMTGLRDPYDGNVRLDFKGGWPGDTENKFLASGRTEAENSIFNWVKKLAAFRKNSSAITTGKLLQYVPENGVYVYFRYDDKQTVMCMLNTADKPVDVNTSRFREGIKRFNSGKEVTTGKVVSVKDSIEIPANYLYVLELK